MKRIIITPFGDLYEFPYGDLLRFNARLFAVLSGMPKKVTIICDESVHYDEVYKIDFL